MDSEATVRQFYKAMSTGDATLLDEILADDWEDIPLPPGTGPGRENFKTDGIGWIRTVFPDFTVTNQDVIVSADGSKVAVRSVSRGTHARDLAGVPPTGKKVEFQAFDIHHLEGGVIVKTWHLEDFSDAFRQLGAQVVPARPEAPLPRAASKTAFQNALKEAT